MRRGVNEDVLGLDVSVANAFCMDVGDSSQHLVGIELDKQVRHHLFHLQVLLHHSIASVGDVIHDYIQIDFVWLISVCIE